MTPITPPSRRRLRTSGNFTFDSLAEILYRRYQSFEKANGEITMAKVFVSSVINAPIDDVWSKVRDFNALPDWHPAVVGSHIENGDPSDKVGCIRNFNLEDGGNIREQLLTLSDVNYLCTYSILESPMAVENYVSTLRLLPITDGHETYAEWTAEFNCPPEEEEGLIAQIGGAVFQGGFDALKSSFHG